MKTANRLISVLLSICLILACASGISAVDGAPNVTMTVSSTSVNVGDEVTVTLGCNEHVVAGFGFYLEFNEDLLECTEVIGPYGDEDPEYYCLLYLNKRGREAEAEPQVADSVDDTNSDGIYSFGWMTTSDVTILEQELITLVFTAKAAGTVDFVLNEQTSGTDEFKGVADTQSVTINAPVSYTEVKIMGSFDGWTNGYTMTTTDGNIYTYAMTLTEAGSFELQIKAGDNWNGCDTTVTDNTSGYDYGFYQGAGNLKFSNSGAGTFTFTYNLTNNTLKIESALDHTCDYIKGVCSCGATKTIYLMGTLTDWGTGAAMTQWVDDYNCYITIDDVTSGTYLFKVKVNDVWYGNGGSFTDTTNGAWTMTTSGGDTTLNASGGSYTFTYNVPNDTITVTYEPAEHTCEFIKGECSCGATIGANLMGTLSNWDPGLAMTWIDNDNLQVVLDLAGGTYEFKIKTQAGTWYGNNGSFNDVTNGEWTMDTNAGNCTLNATGGTYTFTYNYTNHTVKVDAVLPHTHNYGNLVYTWNDYYTSCTVTGTCTSTVGECTAPNLSADCSITAANNNGTLTFTATYGEYSDSKTVSPVDSNAIFVYNTAGWDNVYAYYWATGATGPITWPGVQMTKVEGREKLYAASIPDGYENIIFNDGSSGQTPDLSVPTNGSNVFNNGNSAWGYHTPDKYTVSFVVGSGTVTEQWYYGATPSFSGSTDKAQVGCTTYTFDGWDKEFAAVTGDVTYTAIYTEGTSHVGDTDNDHKCNGCGDTMSECADNNNDHYCDSEGCKDKLTNCVDANADHKCDYTGCGATMSECADNNNDHYCDSEGCKAKLTDCVDANADHKCDYSGCGATMSECADNNNDHYCDSEGCKDKLTDCVDANADHKCDYTGCGATMSGCADNNNDHYCDSEGCKDKLTDCVDANADHKCDYTGCGATMSECADDANDGDHNCDFAGCGKAVADSVCYGGQADCTSGPICEDCGEEHGEALGHGHTEGLSYTDLKNGNHSVTCEDCGTVTIESEAHDYTYDARNHKCICGAVEEFKLTVVYGVNGEYTYEAMVPYWTPMADLDEINNIPWDIYVNDATHLGRYYLDDFYWDMDGDGDLDRDRYFTEGYMPHFDLYVEVRYDFNGFVHDGNGWQYRKYGNFYKNEMIMLTMADLYENGSDEVIEGVYMLDANGYRIENGLGRFYYVGEWPYNGVTYEPNAEDIAYCESKGITFIDAEMTWYYFGADGKWQYNYTGLVGDSYVINGQAAWHVGLVQIGEDYYYFTGDEVNGGNVMATGNVYASRNNTELAITTSGIYTFGADGKLCKYDGITNVDGKLYYYEDYQLMIGAGLIKVEDNYYYVLSDGSLVVGTEYWVAETNDYDVVAGMYTFDENGVLQNAVASSKNGVYAEDNGLFFYENGKRVYKGLIQYTGNGYENAWIYVRSNGQLATGRYWVTAVDGSDFEQGYYQFDENGVMLEQKNGIVAENGSLYYYVDGVIAYNAGVIELDGSYYYVRSNGEVVNGRSYWITNVGNTDVVAKQYTFGADGTFTPEFTQDLKNGIVDGYYYENGNIAYGAGLVKLEDGSYIYVRSSGALATGKYWTTNHNGELPEGMYDFGEDGILVIE